MVSLIFIGLVVYPLIFFSSSSRRRWPMSPLLDFLKNNIGYPISYFGLNKAKITLYLEDNSLRNRLLFLFVVLLDKVVYNNGK